jgi:hypothetical protein
MNEHSHEEEKKLEDYPDDAIGNYTTGGGECQAVFYSEVASSIGCAGAPQWLTQRGSNNWSGHGLYTVG